MEHFQLKLNISIMPDKELLLQIESLLERWQHGRENDDETLESIKQLMIDEGYLNWFKTN